jgi:hypothetical protein
LEVAAENTTREIDCSALSAAELRALLKQAGDSETLLLTGGSHAHGAALCGDCSDASIRVAFPLGDFACLMGSVSSIEIEASVKNCCGHSFHAGSLIVRKTVGSYFGLSAQSGMLASLGTAGDFAGANLAGADVFVRSAAGNFAGQGMQNGTLVLGNGCGNALGSGMRGGVIYVRGDVVSVSQDVKLTRMKDPDLMRLSLLLARVGIKSDGKDFKAYRAKRAVA